MAPFTLLLTFLDPRPLVSLNLYWLEKGLTCLTPFQSNFRVKGRYEISLEQKNYKQRDDFPEAGRWRKEASRAKVKAFQKSQKSLKTPDFQSVELWTAWSEWSLWYQFSTQNLMLFKFHFDGLAKFRHVAILAIFGGYFGYLLLQ